MIEPRACPTAELWPPQLFHASLRHLDTRTANRVPGAALARLFGLTPQQAALAVELSHGYGLNEAAERLGVSRNTAHSHLKQIYEKTGTHRRAELVRLLMTSPAVLDGG